MGCQVALEGSREKELAALAEECPQHAEGMSAHLWATPAAHPKFTSGRGRNMHREASRRPGAWGPRLAGAETNVTKPRVGSYRRGQGPGVGKAGSI